MLKNYKMRRENRNLVLPRAFLLTCEIYLYLFSVLYLLAHALLYLLCFTKQKQN